MHSPVVYVVDDDETALKSVESLLTVMGFATQTFVSPKSLLISLPSPACGCVLADLRMLEMSGLDLLERLSDSHPELPVILISAYADVDTAVTAMQLGAQTCLCKPCTDTQIWAAIREAIEKNADRIRAIEHRRHLKACYESLGTRDKEVLAHLLNGLTSRQIGQELHWSLRTIEKSRSTISKTFGIKSLPALLADLISNGILAAPRHDDPGDTHYAFTPSDSYIS